MRHQTPVSAAIGEAMAELGAPTIAEAAGVSTDTVRRWSRGESVPDVLALRSMQAGLAREHYGPIYAAAVRMLAPEPTEHRRADLDLDGDGRITIDDQRIAMADVVDRAAQMTRGMLTAADRADTGDMERHADELIDLVHKIQEQGHVIAQERRQARPLNVAS